MIDGSEKPNHVTIPLPANPAKAWAALISAALAVIGAGAGSHALVTSRELDKVKAEIRADMETVVDDRLAAIERKLAAVPSEADIKRLRSDMTSDADEVARFKREATETLDLLARRVRWLQREMRECETK